MESTALTIKTAQTQTAVQPLLRKRWSARSFSERMLSDSLIHQLFEAASWAPSSMNEQPWRYAYAVRGSESFEALLDCLDAGNARWAKNAALLVFCMADTRFKAFPDKSNRHALHDVGAANTLLLLEAAANEVYGHEIGGYKREEVRSLLDLPAYMEDVCFIALGYLADAEMLEEPFRTRELTPRSRRSVEQFTQAI